MSSRKLARFAIGGSVNGISEEDREGLAASPETVYCTFCGKSQHEVKKLVAGPTVFICDECVDLCVDICWEDSALRDDAAAKAAEWSRRTLVLRRTIAAISSSDDDAIEPIQGPWLMTASRDPADGSVRVEIKRSSAADGDISIAFSETEDDLADIAAWVATAKEPGLSPKTAHTRINEGIDIALWISGKALLREYERRFELLKLGRLLQSTQALPTDVRHLRDGLTNIIDRNPEQRRVIADVLRETLIRLGYKR
jgi:hypothetical protein